MPSLKEDMPFSTPLRYNHGFDNGDISDKWRFWKSVGLITPIRVKPSDWAGLTCGWSPDKSVA